MCKNNFAPVFYLKKIQSAPKGMIRLQRFFKLNELKTDVKTEILAGITTFVTMAYIIFVNPAILSTTGMDAGAVMVATCLASAIGCIIMGLYANYPFALAPGMGLNAFFAFTICGSMGYSWKAALAAVFISGLLFVIISATGLRTKIVNDIPLYLKKAIAAGIGLFIAYIGVKNSGILSFTSEAGHWVDVGFDTIVSDSAIIPAFSFTSPSALLAIAGLVVTAILILRNVKGALLLSIAITSIIGCVMHFGFGVDLGISLPTGFSVPSLAPTFGQFLVGFGELFNTSAGIGTLIFSFFSVLISLTLVDMFDSIGTFVGAASKAKLLDKNGQLPKANKALLADAVATSVGAVFGTSTVTTYIESCSGISDGGRSGLTAVVTGILFIAAILFAPVLGIVPAAATAPILIIVGVMMMASLKDLEWDKMDIAIPAFLTMVAMPFAYSIADGIALGFIFHAISKLFTGKAKEISGITIIFALLFLVRFILVNI